MKKTGAELITIERQEQIKKHGYSLDRDKRYTANELIKAALFCIEPTVFEWPQFWGTTSRHKIAADDRISQLKKAGSFIAAEIDRLQNKTDNESST